MRCVECDANSEGLSELNPRIPHSFHYLPNGDCLCDECIGWQIELEQDYFDDEEEND